MSKRHDFEAIFTSNDIMNIQDGIGKRFRSIKRTYYIGINADFGPRRINRPHATPNYGPGNISL